MSAALYQPYDQTINLMSNSELGWLPAHSLSSGTTNIFFRNMLHVSILFSCMKFSLVFVRGIKSP